MGHKYADERKLPRLDEQRHAATEVPLHRSRKNTRRWCRGKVGVEHVTEIRYAKWSDRYLLWHGARCLWWPYGRPQWACSHEMACTECGKITTHRMFGRDCPDWKPCET